MTLFFFIAVILRILLIGSIALWLSLRQRRTVRRPKQQLPSEKGPSEEKKVHPLLSEEQAEEYRKRIEGYLQRETPYLNCDYRMRTMVEETGIPRHHLSALINTVYHTNFNNFINKYRIEYLLQHFNGAKWAHLTFEGMAREAGFKNRSTFLKSFKKVTGMTPSQFREQSRSSTCAGPTDERDQLMKYDHPHPADDRCIPCSSYILAYQNKSIRVQIGKGTGRQGE